MTEGSIEHQRLSPACQKNLRECRAALGRVQLAMIEAMELFRKAMKEMPPGEVQVLLSKSLHQRFQPATGPLGDIIMFGAQLESFCRGGEVGDISRRIGSKMLEVMAKGGGVAVEIVDGQWHFTQEADPSIAAGKKRLEALLSKHSTDETRPPEE